MLTQKSTSRWHNIYILPVLYNKKLYERAFQISKQKIYLKFKISKQKIYLKAETTVVIRICVDFYLFY